MPTDTELIAETAKAAAGARGAAEAVSGRLDTLAANVEALIRVVERQRTEIAELADRMQATVQAVTDVDHPKGATYLVCGLGASKTWIRSGEQWADLINAFPWLSPPAQWSGRTLAAIPTIGEDPPS